MVQKRRVVLFLSALLFSQAAWAAPLTGSNPVVLAHGLFGWGQGSGGVISLAQYWGGEDAYLRSQGVPVFTTTVSAANSTDYRANQLKTQISQWMAANGYTHVNIIGHSQGGLDSRYMISNLGMASKVRILTTLNTPHQGTPFADITLAVIPSWLQSSVNALTSLLLQLVYGNSQQNAINALKSLTIANAAAFNSSTPNNSAVKYYSYGSHMAWADLVQHPLMGLTYPIMLLGDAGWGVGLSNDGIVPESSMQWGTWKGGPSYGLLTTGIDHLEATNLLYYGQNFYDVNGYFLSMSTNAKNNQ